MVGARYVTSPCRLDVPCSPLSLLVSGNRELLLRGETILTWSKHWHAYLYNTNRWNIQFSKLIFKVCCLLHVSNLVGLEHTLLPSRQLTPMHAKHTVLHIQLSPWAWTHDVRKMCSRRKKLHINLENCAFRWMVLYNYVTLHGAKSIKLTCRYWWILQMHVHSIICLHGLMVN